MFRTRPAPQRGAQRGEPAAAERSPVKEALKLFGVVELLFMMLILKLPILYLAGVCYWAIKAEPEPLEEARVTAQPEPGPGGPSFRRRPRRPSSHGGPRRREPRTARAAVRPPA